MNKLLILVVFICLVLVIKSSIYSPEKNAPIITDFSEEETGQSLSSKYVRLKRGEYVYTMKRGKTWKKERYIIGGVYLPEDRHELHPHDFFVVRYYMFPEDEDIKWSIRNNIKSMSSENKDFDRWYKAAKRWEKGQMNVYIWTADSEVEEIAKQIKKHDIVEISGHFFHYTKKVHKGEEKDLSLCDKTGEKLYVTDMRVIDRL